MALQDLYKGAQKGASEMVLKGAFHATLELLFFMQLSKQKSVKNDSKKKKSKIEIALYC